MYGRKKASCSSSYYCYFHICKGTALFKTLKAKVLIQLFLILIAWYRVFSAFLIKPSKSDYLPYWENWIWYEVLNALINSAFRVIMKIGIIM